MRRSNKKVSVAVYHSHVEFFLFHSSVNEKFLSIFEKKGIRDGFFELAPEKLPLNTRFNVFSGVSLFSKGSFLLFFRITITHKTIDKA